MRSCFNLKMKLVLITTAIFSLYQAHHRGHHGRDTLIGRHDKFHKLLDKLKANPPKCQNNETICERPENEYPRELVELLMKNINIPEEIEFYSDYFDNRAKYLRWLYQSYTSSSKDPCRSEMVDVFLPKVAHNIKGEPVYIVQQEPYDIKKISYFKCLDGEKDGCSEVSDFLSRAMTLDPSGEDIRLTDIVYPIGCLSTLVVTGTDGEDNRNMTVKDYLLNQYQLKHE